MGITGLLPFLKAIQKDVHLSSLKGRKAAVDAYCWLHKGSYSCAMQLVMGTDKLEALPFIKYCMKKVHMLRQYDITPIMVFDGGHLPTKALTERDRRERRREYRDKGKQLLKEGKRSNAVDCFQKCVDVSPEMALALIKECRKVGVECVVAPYEADAQLTYLQKEGLADLVITEDSDLLVFGAQRVLFKLDDSGRGKLIELKDLGKANKGLIGFTQDSFRQMCIFSGCDYLASVPGIGLGKSLKLMRRCNQNPTQVIRALQYESGKVPSTYEQDFWRAEHTFLYQLVFDPRTQTQVRLHPLPDSVDEVDFAGIEHSPKKAVSMARGNINPISLKVLDDYSPAKAPPPKSTSWTDPVMGFKSLPIQAKLPLLVSERTRQPFRVPKRKLEEEDSVDVCSLYATQGANEGGSLGNEIITSRFFTSNEATPTEVNSDPIHPARRALTDQQLSQHSPVKKQLFTESKEVTDGKDSARSREGVQIMWNKYQYKKQRTEHINTTAFNALEQSNEPSNVQCEEPAVSRNPFSKFKGSPKKSPSFRLTDTSPPENPSLEQTEPPPNVPSSSSFLTPHPSLRQDSPPSNSSLKQDLNISLQPASLKQDHPLPRPALNSSLKQDSTNAGWLGKSTHSNKRTVGLSKSTSRSKFKAPRPSDNQPTLGVFGYTRRSQLKH